MAPKHHHGHVVMPTQVTDHVGPFDRFAGGAADFASRAPFFAVCVLLIVVWAPSLPLFGSLDTWQLVINTATTIVTFLLVALLQNSQARNDSATQHKLNAVATGLAILLQHHGHDEEVAELQRAVGLERYESTT